jgi:hypothetical protein
MKRQVCISSENGVGHAMTSEARLAMTFSDDF